MNPIHRTFQDRNGAPYVVRDAVPEDAPHLVELLNRVGQEEVYIADERAQLTADQEASIIQARNPDVQVILVAEQNGTTAGSLEMIRGILRKNRHTALFGMALLPEFRGRHIGRGMLLAAEDWAREAGVRKISLAVFATNQAAIHLYESLGYAEEGRRHRQYLLNDNWIDEIWMARWL